MKTAPDILRGDVDTPRPIRATSGLLTLEGWCLVSGDQKPPAVRLVADAFTLAMTERVERADLAQQMPDEPAAQHSGFSFNSPLPPGVHLARLEGELRNGSWIAIKTLVIAVEPSRFVASLDSEQCDKIYNQRTHLEGWALHPEKPLKTLSLRYGHQEIPCVIGKPRRDLTARYPLATHAGESGFKSKTILGAGYGELRLKGTFDDGSVAIAKTPLRVTIASDENTGAEIDLQAERIGLPATDLTTKKQQSPPDSHPLNVLFVLHGSFASNSALHVTALANELSQLGHDCIVAVTHDLTTLKQHRDVRFTGILHTDAAKSLPYANQQGPDIIHAWTTRENVRLLTEQVRQQHPDAKVLIHLEDNEQHILAEQIGLSVEQLSNTITADLDKLIPNDLSHPERSHEFRAACDGITLITERLAEFAPENVHQQLLWPAADASCFYPRPSPADFRSILNWSADETVLFYPGNAHAANAEEVQQLYLAVELLNRNGHPTTLIRTGLDDGDYLQETTNKLASHILQLGQIPHHHHLPALMALADFFVQPGTADAFNDYRFPSKLPEFFSIGRPVILPRTNLGQIVQHKKDAYVLDNADAEGIYRAVKELRHDPYLRDVLSQGALDFAEKYFSWNRSAAELASFYRRLTS